MEGSPVKLLYPIKTLSFGKEPDSNAAFLHEAYLKHRKKYLFKGHSKRATIILAGKWYWEEVFQESRALIRQNGKKVQEMTGIPVWRQYIDMVKLSLTLPCRPQSYYIFDLFNPANRAVAKDYLFRHEVKNVLYKMLTKIDKLGKLSPLTDKGAFAQRAHEFGLPLAPTICSIANQEVIMYEDAPKDDIFVKALDGRGGRGAEVWHYHSDKNTYKRKKDKKRYAFVEIIEKYKQHSDKKPIIIQTRLKNHPEVADLSCDAVSTCRVVTLLNEEDQPEVTVAVFRMAARKGKIVDNIHKGGIAAPIDIETGTLGKATNLGKEAGLGRLSTHPVTGGIIEGRTLPHWDEIVALAIKAHECFRPRVIVGWDICITDRGPVIIEGNAQPCVDLAQRPHNQPLGSTRFGELMAFHIRRNFAQK